MPDALASPGDHAPQPIRLADYRPPDFLIDTVDLAFDLGEAETLVKAHLTLRRNPAAADPQAPLRLDGDELELVSLALDSVALDAERYQHTPEGGLLIPGVPDAFALDIETRI